MADKKSKKQNKDNLFNIELLNLVLTENGENDSLIE